MSPERAFSGKTAQAGGFKEWRRKEPRQLLENQIELKKLSTQSMKQVGLCGKHEGSEDDECSESLKFSTPRLRGGIEAPDSVLALSHADSSHLAEVGPGRPSPGRESIQLLEIGDVRTQPKGGAQP